MRHFIIYTQNKKIMKKIRAAIVGYGNIGHYTLQALEAAPDFEVAGIVRRNGAENRPEDMPSSAATTKMAMSVTAAPRARMAVKASWPGVSRKVI